MTSLGRIGAYGLARRLPYDAEVEYLESTGTQWIDTGVALAHYSISATFGIVSNSQFPVVASRRSTTGYQRAYPLFLANRKFYRVFGSSYSAMADSPTLVAGEMYSAVAKNESSYSIECEGITMTGDSVGMNFSATLFADVSDRTIGTIQQGGYGRIKSVTIYDSDGDIRFDAMSVRFTNELGRSEGAMFDRANPTVGMNPDGSPRTDGLYRNRGTGSFLFGADKSNVL